MALLASLAAAQPATGSVSGVVRDPSGAAVPDAVVTVENESTAIIRAVRTDHSGSFSIPALPPTGGYTITVNKPGFAEYQVTGIEILVGEEIRIEPELALSPAGTRVSVQASAPLLSPAKTEVSQVVEDSHILNLPINGRRVDTYVLLTPAVVPDGVLGLVSFRGIAGGNAFLTDGNDTSNQFFNENAGRTRVYTQISQDAVQEFQVLTSGSSAEFGRASGGIINTVTRSGSNDLHGTAYLFFRNRSLNARDPYSTVNPPEKRYQFGAALGGPLSRDRLFFFLNQETHRRDFPLVASLARPPLFNPDGSFAGTCGPPATSAQCAAALAFLQRQFRVLERRADSELGFARLDWSVSAGHHLSASFNYLRWISPNGFQTQAVLNNGEGLGANGNSSVRTRYARLAWHGVFAGTKVNEFRFGWFKDRHSDAVNPALTPAETGLVQIVVQGQPNLGVSPDLPRIDPSENRFQIADTIIGISGRHAWKAGVDLVHTRDYVRYLRNRNGTYEYADFTSFAQDFSANVLGARRWQSYSQRFGDETYDDRIRDYNFFAEDQFRAGSRLTLTYGLRYEYAALPQPGDPNPAYPWSGRVPSSKTNLAPRFGFAWGFDNSRAVLRGGYGVYYARYPSGLMATFFQENGVGQQPVQFEGRFLLDPAFGPVFPTAMPALRTPARPSDPSFASAIDLTLPSPAYRNGYTQQGDLAVSRVFSPKVMGSVAWLWSRGLHLTTVRDLNIGPPGPDVIYDIQDASGKTVGTFTTPGYRLVNRVNPDWRRVNLVESGGNSYYNALVVQLRKRVSRGFEGFLSYTWAHAIDFNQGGGADNLFYADGPRSLRNGDYRGDKASSQLDQRHRLVAGGTWDPVLTSSKSRLAQALLNHWRLSHISTFASCQPATPVVLVSGVAFPGAAFNNTLNGFGGSPRVPFLPPSSLDIGRVARTDARLTKIVPFRERWQLHLNFEAFNILNHVSNTAVNTVAYEAKDGVLRPVARLGEGVASQGYPDGTNARRAQVSVRVTW
jgi:hypothetical protein